MSPGGISRRRNSALGKSFDVARFGALVAARAQIARSAVAHFERVGGARRDRTDDLLLAKQALSQLSYGPVGRVGFGPTETRSQKSKIDFRFLASEFWLLTAGVTHLIMVGLGRLELPTSRLSGVRSNHLSYRPDFALFALLPEERETETAESRSSLKDPVRFLNRSVV